MENTSTRRKVVIGIVAMVMVSVGIRLVHGMIVTQQRQGEELALEAFSDTLKKRLDGYIAERISMVKSLKTFLAENEEWRPEEFDELANSLVGNRSGIKALQWATSEAVVAHSYPLHGNEKAIGHRLMDAPHIRPFIEKAIRERRMTANDPYVLLQGGLGLILRAPALFDDGRLRGLAIAVLDIDAMLSEIVEPDESERYTIRILNSKREAFLGSIRSLPEPVVERPISVADNSWIVQVALK